MPGRHKILNPLDRVIVVWDDNTELTGMMVEHNSDYVEILGNDGVHNFVPRGKYKNLKVDHGLTDDGLPDGFWDGPDDDDDDDDDPDPAIALVIPDEDEADAA